MSREEYTESLLIEAYKLGIYNQVLELADFFLKYKKMDRYEAFDKAFHQLKSHVDPDPWKLFKH